MWRSGEDQFGVSCAGLAGAEAGTPEWPRETQRNSGFWL